jgi:hypothetical protein
MATIDCVTDDLAVLEDPLCWERITPGMPICERWRRSPLQLQSLGNWRAETVSTQRVLQLACLVVAVACLKTVAWAVTALGNDVAVL